MAAWVSSPRTSASSAVWEGSYRSGIEGLSVARNSALAAADPKPAGRTTATVA
jgi:hypothetical protein